LDIDTYFSDTAISAVGPWLWINLSTNLRQQDLLHSRFRPLQKTFLFGECEPLFKCALGILYLPASLHTHTKANSIITSPHMLYDIHRNQCFCTKNGGYPIHKVVLQHN